MRNIGVIATEKSAQAFSDFLYVHGISNDVESDAAGWAIWVHAEDELKRASALLEQFRSNPDDPRYWQHAQAALALKEEEEQQHERAARRFHDRTTLFRASMSYRLGLVTLLLVGISVGVTILTGTDPKHDLRRWLAMSEYFHGLPEVRAGQVWRLITPIFMHGGFIHLLFNMLWMIDLGSMIEARESSRRLLALVIVSAALSNLAEYQWGGHGPHFSGMSGVVYALVAYVWLKGRLHPASGLYVQPAVMLLTMVWFVMCWLGWIQHIANMCHTGGLVVGLVLGFVSAKWERR